MKTSHSSEYWNALNVEFHGGCWGQCIYLYIGNYLELCFGEENGGIGSISLIIKPHAYRISEPTALTSSNQTIGYPLFKRKTWLSRIDPSYESPQHLKDRPYQEFELYLQDNTVTMMLWPHPIDFIVKNNQISFGFNSEKRLCLIKLTDLTEPEMARIVENLSTSETPFTATLNTLNYAHAANKDLNHLQLKNIQAPCSEKISSDLIRLLKINFNTNNLITNSIVTWSIDGLLELHIDQSTGSLINITLLQAPSVYFTAQLYLPSSLHSKIGMPTFKTKEWSTATVLADVNHQQQFDIFLTKNSLVIVLWPHYAALTITNGRVTFGFNINKTLCSIRIINFSLEEMNQLKKTLSNITSITEASHAVINYSLLDKERKNMLQLKDIAAPTREIVESDFYRPLRIKFCEQPVVPEDYIDWRIDAFIEIGLHRATGAIIEFTLRRHCKVGKSTQPEALLCKNKKSGLPLFKTLLWLEGTPEKEKRPQSECMFFLGDDNATFILLPHPVEQTIINNRVIFGFNNTQSLCSITITNLTADEMGLLADSLNYQIKNQSESDEELIDD